MKKLTLEDFTRRSSEIHNNKFDYSKAVYVNSSTKVEIICPIHGSFLQKPNDHLNGIGCAKCSKVAKLTTEDFISRSIESRGGSSPYDYSKVKYINNTEKVIVVCSIHGEFLQNPKDHYENKSNCPECHKEKVRSIGISQRSTLDEFIDKSRILFGDKYIFSKFEYLGSKENGIIICPVHGEFVQSPNVHLCGKGCPKCELEDRSLSLRVPFEKFVKRAVDIHGTRYIYDKNSYTMVSSKINIFCLKHGKFSQSASHHLNGSGCPVCNYSISKFENEVYQYILSIYSGNVLRRYRPKFLDGKEIDIYIPEFNLGIEVNGGYWHSKKPKNYHFDKWNSCRQNNITLLTIWDFYWMDDLKKSVYFSKIKHLLMMDKRIYARKTSFEEVGQEVAVSFHKENHLEGFSIPYKNSKHIALTFENEIVMIATYGEFFDQSKKQYLLKVQRMTTKKGLSIVGGLSKLIKRIEEIENKKPIFQVTLDTGGKFLNIDFSKITPRYWWIKSDKYLTRNRTQRHILAKNEDFLSSDTEESYMTRHGYSRVYDCGIANLII